MTHPLARLPKTFGTLLRTSRVGSNRTLEDLARATGLPVEELARMEQGENEPTLTNLFQLAGSLSVSPEIFLIDIVASWRAGGASDPLYKSRASDFQRVYRLGWHHDPGDFRELPKTFDVINHASDDARQRNEIRRKKSQVLLDTICIYVRMAYVPFPKPSG